MLRNENLACRYYEEDGIWVCYDKEKNEHIFIDKKRYDILADLVESSEPRGMVREDVDRVVDLYRTYEHEYGDIIEFYGDTSMGHINSCLEKSEEKIPSLYYCWVDGLIETMKDVITWIGYNDADWKTEDYEVANAFKEWLSKELKETEIKPNLTIGIKLKCVREPKNGLCMMVTNALRGKRDEVESKVKRLFEKWLEGEGENYSERVMERVLEME